MIPASRKFRSLIFIPFLFLWSLLASAASDHKNEITEGTFIFHPDMTVEFKLSWKFPGEILSSGNAVHYFFLLFKPQPPSGWDTILDASTIDLKFSRGSNILIIEDEIPGDVVRDKIATIPRNIPPASWTLRMIITSHGLLGVQVIDIPHFLTRLNKTDKTIFSLPIPQNDCYWMLIP
jgi:hypothetical protein